MQTAFRFSFSISLIAVALLSAPAYGQSAPSASMGTPAAVAPIVEPPLPAQKTMATPPRDDVSTDEDSADATAERAADRGFLLPFTQSPQVFSGQAVVRTIAGYDSALKDFVARTSADARILRFLALRVDFDHGPGMGPDNRFGVGARLALLRQSAHGVDGAISLTYQPNDFRQEGQIVGSVLLGRSFGRLRLIGNVLFGSDAEGDDQAGEARVSALYRVLQRLHVGFDSRFRFNASEDEKRAGTQTTDFEFQALPTASFAVGPVAFLAQSGLSMIQRTGPFGTPQEKTRVSSGVVALAGMGGAF